MPGGRDSARERRAAVRAVVRARRSRPPVSARLYTAYLGVLAAVVYVVPVAVLVAQDLPSPAGPGASWAALDGHAVPAVGVLAALTAGGVWGPLVLSPFVLHVLTDTDGDPVATLSDVVGRRVAVAAVVVGALAAAAAVVLATGGAVVIAAAGVSGAVLGITVAIAWLVGQVAPPGPRALLGASWLALVTAAAATPGLAVPVAAALGGIRASVGALLGGLVLQTMVLVLAGVAATHWWRGVDVARLRRDAARVAGARAYVATGTVHDALDLFRPPPIAVGSVISQRTGRVRSLVAQGVVRAGRTPSRGAAGVVALVLGGALIPLGAEADSASPSWPALVGGAVLAYVGIGWVCTTWTGLRDQLLLPPVHGGGPRAAVRRASLFPVTVVSASAVLGLVGVAVVTEEPPGVGTVVAALGMAGVVLAGRFLREMKSMLPVDLLTPIPTPFGDLSGLRVFVWQVDGLVVVGLTAGVVAEVVTLAAAPVLLVVLAVSVAGACARAGLSRVGHTPSSVLTST